MTVIPSHRPRPTTTSPQTPSPLQLLAHDLALIARLAWALPSFLWPLRSAGPLADLAELAPTLANAWCIVVHAVLAVFQMTFLFGIVPLAGLLLPAWVCAALVAICLGVSRLACRLLLNYNNGTTALQSRPACATNNPEHTGEHWLFVNGVGTGRHWMQSSLDRLAYTFGRPVVGIHNKTAGLVVDLVECLVLRAGYATPSVAAAHAVVRDALCRADTTRVMLVLHSQGGLVGGLVLDRLQQELPQSLLAKLEVFTFGSAASSHSFKTRGLHLPTHIENYAHATDAVALWGVLHHSGAGAAQVGGRVFVSPRGGHQLCQHYLDGMFPLARDAATGRVQCAETSELMDSVVGEGHKVKDVSRLWQYRNGGSPP